MYVCVYVYAYIYVACMYVCVRMYVYMYACVKHTMDTMKKGPHISPRAQMIQGVPADEVVCKEGLQLMKKSRDGSAACVSSSTASKLEERGWGTIQKETTMMN